MLCLTALQQSDNPISVHQELYEAHVQAAEREVEALQLLLSQEKRTAEILRSQSNSLRDRVNQLQLELTVVQSNNREQDTYPTPSQQSVAINTDQNNTADPVWSTVASKDPTPETESGKDKSSAQYVVAGGSCTFIGVSVS